MTTTDTFHYDSPAPAQVKEVCGIFQETYDFLGGQVKGYEERAREEKRQQVLFAIETLTAEAGYPGLPIPVQDSWLNKTQKDKQTAAEIKAIIADHIKAERDAAALEQAKQDRAAFIEAKCADLGRKKACDMRHVAAGGFLKRFGIRPVCKRYPITRGPGGLLVAKIEEAA